MFDTMSRRHRRFATSAAALLLVAVTAACSSSGTGAGPSSSTSTTAANAALGPVDKATGSPLTIGYITDGKSASIDFSALQQTAQAAVKYVNERLGGVGGRPISLKVCETQQSPARAADCANQMVQANVPVVLNDLTGVGPTIVPIIAKAKIPYISFSGSTTPELTTKNVYSLTGSIASFLGGIAEYSKEQGYKKVAVVAMNIPAVIQGLNTLGKLVFGHAGVQMPIVTVAPGAADLSPQMETIIAGHADAMLVFGDSTICAASLKAAKALAFSGTRMVVSQCVQAASAKSIPDGYKGVVVSATTNLQNGNKEYELYKSVLKQYSPGTAAANSADAGATEGYGAVLGFARAMAAVKRGAITPALVSSTIASAKNIPLPVGGGLTFSCDGTAVAGLPGICSVGAQVTTLDESGSPTTYKTIDAASLFK